MSHTEQQIRDMIVAKDTLRELVETYFWQRFAADPTWRTTGSEDPEDDSVGDGPNGNWLKRPILDRDYVVTTTEVKVSCRAPACRRGCCGEDQRTYVFPTSYLWLDQAEVLADLKAKAEIEQAERAVRQAAQEAHEAKQQEIRELAQLTLLQAKYGRTGLARSQAPSSPDPCQYGVPAINLDDFDIDAGVAQLVPAEVCFKHKLVPVNKAGCSLIVAMVNPGNVFAIDDLKFLTGYNIEVVVADEASWLRAYERVYCHGRIENIGYVG
jgi:hypothetical protein